MQGTATPIADTTTHYRWQCVGENSGTTAANCSKARPTCDCNNSVESGCSGHTGCTALQTPDDTDALYRWSCRYNNDPHSNSGHCHKAKPLPQCGGGGSNCAASGTNNAAGCCTVGVFHGHPADTTTEWKWTCKRSLTDNSANASCSAQKPNGGGDPPPQK